MKIRLMRQFAAVLALAFVLTAPPASAMEANASDEGCWACAMCYEDISCLSCGVLALNAISGCCGMGIGDTYCVPEYGGFAVNCSSGRACQCDGQGGNCDPLEMAGG
jgi:hypothetical protein